MLQPFVHRVTKSQVFPGTKLPFTARLCPGLVFLWSYRSSWKTWAAFSRAVSLGAEGCAGESKHSVQAHPFHQPRLHLSTSLAEVLLPVPSTCPPDLPGADLAVTCATGHLPSCLLLSATALAST